MLLVKLRTRENFCSDFLAMFIDNQPAYSCAKDINAIIPKWLDKKFCFMANVL